MRNTVFISYPSDDFPIASAINNAIKAMPENKLEVFWDRQRLGGGQTISETIQAGLRETVYFVGVATNVARRNFDWCGRELGFYQGSYDQPGTRREACIFHLSYPNLFAANHNFKVQSLRREHRSQFHDDVVLVDKCAIYDFLIGVAQLNAELHPPLDPVAYFNAIPKWAESHAHLITESFFAALQVRVENTWYPQGRIQLTITNGDFYREAPKEIPKETGVELSSSIYLIFGCGIPEIEKELQWEEFKEFLVDNSGSDILSHMLSDIAVNVLPSRADAKGDYVYQAPDQQFYRVLLVRHSVFGSKKRQLVFNLIKTLDKVQSGNPDTTALVAGIVIGSKYRSLFLEEGSKYQLEALSNLPVDELGSQLEAMLRDIDRINADAASDGLADFRSLVTLFEDAPEVKDLFFRWRKAFPAMEESAKAIIAGDGSVSREEFLKYFSDFIEASRVNNVEFLKMCLKRYSQTLG